MNDERARALKTFLRARAAFVNASRAMLKRVRSRAKAMDARKPAKGARGRGRPSKSPLRKAEEGIFALVLKGELRMLQVLGYSRDESLALIADALNKSPKTIEDMLYAARRRRRVRKPRSAGKTKTGD